MHLFRSPWLHATTPSTRPATRRTGAARRIAALLQLEAARKPADAELALAPAPATCIVADATLLQPPRAA